MSLRKAIVLSFIGVMSWFFWKYLLFGLEILKVKQVTDGLALLSLKGVLIVDIFSNLLDAKKTVVGISSALLQSVSIPSLALFTIWWFAFKKQKLWPYFCGVIAVYLILNAGTILLFVWLLSLTDPSLALMLAYSSGWVVVIVSGICTLAGIAVFALVLSDTVAIEA